MLSPKKVTPLHIQMMLHYYAIATPYAVHEPEHASSPAVQKYRYQLYKWGLLEPNDSESGWYPTAQGREYIERLLDVCISS